MRQHAQEVRVTRCIDATAAGTADQIDGTGLDMADFDGVMFIAMFGVLTATAVTTLIAEQSSDDAGADAYAGILGSEVSIADDEDTGMLILDVLRPTEQWVRPAIVRLTANAVIDGVVAIQYNAANKPTVHDVVTVMSTVMVADAIEGTP
jgi:hypothetical protein